MMTCELCGGRVTWRGPLSELTHTQCEKCNEVNCQAVDADGEDICDDTQQAKAMPDGYALVPVDLLRDVSESLGSFVSDEGWAQKDMDVMDSVDALLARHMQGEVTNATDAGACQVKGGKMAGVLVGLLCGWMCGADWQAQREKIKRSAVRRATPCGNAEHYEWEDDGWPCPVCVANDDRAQAIEKRDGLADLVATKVAARLKPSNARGEPGLTDPGKD